MSYWSILLVSAPILLVMSIGWSVRRLGWLSAEADESLLRLVVNLLYPCLIFESVLGNAAARLPANLGPAPLLGLLTVAFGFWVCWMGARLARIPDGPKRRTFALSGGIYNYGYIPVPLVQAFFPSAIGVLFVFNLGVEVALWTLGVLILGGGEGRPIWRRILNPAVGAILLGLAANLGGLEPLLPKVLLNSVHLLGGCAIPLGLLLIGATVADSLSGPTPRIDWKTMAWAWLLRLGILPLAFIALARCLPLSTELRQILVIQAAMPSAVIPIVLARHYRGDVATALWVVLGTTAVGIFLIPWWIQAGLHLAIR